MDAAPSNPAGGLTVEQSPMVAAFASPAAAFGAPPPGTAIFCFVTTSPPIGEVPRLLDAPATCAAAFFCPPGAVSGTALEPSPGWLPVATIPPSVAGDEDEAEDGDEAEDEDAAGGADDAGDEDEPGDEDEESLDEGTLDEESVAEESVDGGPVDGEFVEDEFMDDGDEKLSAGPDALKSEDDPLDARPPEGLSPGF